MLIGYPSFIIFELPLVLPLESSLFSIDTSIPSLPRPWDEVDWGGSRLRNKQIESPSDLLEARKQLIMMRMWLFCILCPLDLASLAMMNNSQGCIFLSLFLTCPLHLISIASKWLTYPRNVRLTAPAKSAVSTKFTRLPSTSLERPPTSPRESVVTTLSKWVSVDRPSPSSTRRPRPPVRLCLVWSVSHARPRSI